MLHLKGKGVKKVSKKWSVPVFPQFGAIAEISHCSRRQILSSSESVSLLIKELLFMPTLLSEPTSLSVKKRNPSFTTLHHSSMESAHCSPPTTNTFSPSFIKSLLSLVLVIGFFQQTIFRYTSSISPLKQGSRACDIITCQSSRNLNQLNGENFIWKTLYDGLGNRTWNLYGPDRSGTYGGAQGIGGLESGYQEATGFVYNTINNYFGDIVGIVAPTYRNPAHYPGVVGGYGPMPGSDVNHDLEPQWRGHYLDVTGFYYLGARYYNPQSGKFLSPDPLGHDANMDLYSYCNGDPVNGLDPDGRCVEGASAGWAEGNGSFAGTYDASEANSQLAYGLGWTVGGAIGDVNAMVVRPVAYAAAGIVGTALWGINTAVEAADQVLGAPGALEAFGFMTAPFAAAGAFGEIENTATANISSVKQTPLLTQGSQSPNAGGVIRSFIQETDKIYHRVFSENQTGSFLTAVKPKSSSFAQEALALPPENTANYIQEVLVPSGTRLQRSRATAAFGRSGGAEQFQLLDNIPNSNFGKEAPLL